VTLNLALAALLGVRSWIALGGTIALLLGAAGVAFYASKQERPNIALALPIVVLSSCGFALTSSLFGPFAFAPTLCALNAVCFSVLMDARIRRHAIAWAIAAIVVPVFAQFSGVVPASWVFTGGVIEIVPRIVDFSPTSATVFLTVVSAGAVLFPALLVGAERDARSAAERALALQAHQLAEFLPPEAKGSVGDSLATSATAVPGTLD
jgi:serine/threonine-protein kinase